VGPTNDELFFRYTDNVNGGRWEAVTKAGGVETATDTGIAVVANTWYKLRLVVNAAATSVAFSINGALVATNVSNITTAIISLLAIQLFGAVGAGGSGQIDYVKPTFVETVPR
jgi:hypothetical protein